MITCPHCGSINSAGAVYCVQCRTNVHWNPKSPKKNASGASDVVWWPLAVLSAPAFGGAGFVIGVSTPGHTSDWLGGSFFAPIIMGALLGAIVSVACAVVSVVKGERGRLWGILAAIPCLAYTAWMLLIAASVLLEILGR